MLALQSTALELAARLLCLATSVDGAPVVPTHANLVYATVSGHELHLDLYLPNSGPAPYPLIVWIHGGSWTFGAKQPLPFALTPALDHGIAIASIDYRLLSQASEFQPASVVFPAQIHDVKGALRWLRAHAAAYNLDIARFAAVGASAGGHLAALAALSGDESSLEGTVGDSSAWSSRVCAFVDYYGPTDVLHLADDVMSPPGTDVDHDAPTSPESMLLGWSGPGQGVGDIKQNASNPNAPYPALVALAASASPLAWVSAGDPPGFIAHGLADTIVPSAQSAKLAAALVAANVDVIHIEQPHVGHEAFDPVVDGMTLLFLANQLLPQSASYVPALSTLEPAIDAGQSWTFELAAQAGAQMWVVYAGAPCAAPIELPQLGTLLLDVSKPVSALIGGVFASGASSAQPTLPIPSDAALQGNALVLQALATTSSSARLSNALTVFVN